MNASILTMDSRFVLPVAGVGAALRADAKHVSKLARPVADSQLSEPDPVRTEKPDNVAADAEKELDAARTPDKPAREFRQVLREKTGADRSAEVHGGNQPEEPAAVSDSDEPKQVASDGETEDSVGVPQSEDAPATTVEPQAEQELGRLIASSEPQKSQPVTGHAAKSAQIKALLAAGVKGQLGLKTVLPENSNGLNGLKVDLPDGSAIASGMKAQAGAGAKTDNGVALSGAVANAKALNTGADAITEAVSENSGNAGGKTAASNKQPQMTDVSADSDGSKASATDAAKDFASSSSADKDNLITAGGAKAQLSSPLPSTETDLPQQTPNDPPKVVPNAKVSVRPAQAKSPDANGRESAGAGSDTSNAPSLGKSGVTEVRVSDSQSKNQGRSASEHGTARGIEQMPPPTDPPAPPPQPTAAATNAKPANLPGQNASADVSKQIFESIHGSPSQQGAERQITVRLNPPELGRVFIKLQEHEAGLTGILHVDKPQTRFEIEHALPEIIRNLADCGIHVRRFDVVVSEQGRSGHEAFGGQSMPNNGRYEHNPSDRQAWADEPDLGALSAWSPGSYSSRIFSEPQELLVTDGSINMLI